MTKTDPVNTQNKIQNILIKKTNKSKLNEIIKQMKLI